MIVFSIFLQNMVNKRASLLRIPLLSLFALSLMGFLETTRTVTLNGKEHSIKKPTFPLEGGCRGIRADSRGNGIYGQLNTRRHNAVDWYAPVGTEIKSPWPGRVEASKPRGSGGAGGFVQIKHDNGFTTKYAHLKKRFVKTGDIVTAKQPIGTVGKTGNAKHRHTHPHLHFQLIFQRRSVNPTNPNLFRCHSYAKISDPEERLPNINRNGEKQVVVCKKETRCP